MENTDLEWFFFTSTARKHPDASDSSRASRCTGSGRWKTTRGIKKVFDSNLNVLGYKQSFCYMEKRPSGGESKTIWLMEEYSIRNLRTKAGASAITGSDKLDDWVICKIYMTPKARKIHATQEDVPEIPVNRAMLEPEAKRRRMEDAPTMSSLYMHPIASHCQILQLPDDTPSPLIDMLGIPIVIDSYSSTQHAGEETSIPSQDIADFFHTHQPADGTLPQSEPTVPMPVEIMAGPEHVSKLANLDQFPKDIDAEDSDIVFSSEIMQDGGEETEEMAALIRSLCDDIPMPSIDDILR